MKHLALVVALALADGYSAFAQTHTRDVYSVQVLANGDPVPHPFTGGLYNPMHQFVDIGSDGDLDLFVYEPTDGRMTFYRNEGTPSTPSFRQEAGVFALPPVFGWFRLADISGDGLPDLMTSSSEGNSLAIYLNSGSPSVPAFTLLTNTLLDSAGTIVYSETFSVAAFADMDGDGDRDFFSLNTSTGTINHYENIGGQTNFLLAFRTDRYQDVQICIGCAGRLPEGGSHGNGAVSFQDIDADNDADMLYGDFFHTGLYYYQNNGNAASAQLDSVTSWFPVNDPVLTDGFNQATMADIDGDGDQDLFVSVMNSLVRFDNFRLYTNTGTPSAFQFTETSRNYIGTLDFGLQSAPAVTDIDNDGDTDLFAGDLDGRLAFLQNIGSPTDPVFNLEDSALVTSGASFMYAPAFADIDGDSDEDLFIGHFVGKIEFWRNTGSASAPVFTRNLWMFDTVSVGAYAAPSFFDADNDGDPDLILGSSLGTLRYYRNTGSLTIPRFELVTAAFQGIAVVGNAKPVFFDEDGDGDADLLVGDSDGLLRLYRNDGPPQDPVFVLMSSRYAEIDTVHEAAVTAADIDGDGDADLMVGCQRGGLELYWKNGPTAVEPIPTGGIAERFFLGQNYPNPFNSATSFEISIARPATVLITIHDILGQTIATITRGRLFPGTYRMEWDSRGQSSGVYFLRMSADAFVQTRRLILLR